MSGQNYSSSYSGGTSGSDNGLAYGGNAGGSYGERIPGARRQKVLGYLRAANELRQSYQSSLSTRYLGDEGNESNGQGAFSDADIVRSGDEEMLLFPSYARKHIKRSRQELRQTEHATLYQTQTQTQTQSGGGQYQDPGDADYWRKEWEKMEDENAVVDVDVRGWIYSPQRGPMSRRNRLLVAMARRLSGVPAPDQYQNAGHDATEGSSWTGRAQGVMTTQEEEAAAREADMLARHGQREADAAWRGNYYADADRNRVSSRSSSPSGHSIRTSTTTASDDTSSVLSWNMQPDMSREEILRANEQLMTRLRPFMTLPLANSPITVFFFNDGKSQSKSVTTDESGHFNLRAALDFVPTKVRVLASENLSAVEDVIVTDAQGVSLVSDIDDTIKHSAIANGAKEIFKNTFIRELGDLTIEGVREWYTQVAEMGVKLHYVSNSPWQLYPLLKNYFSLAGLPPGSFHLKQYSGMLQGIFEPAAERKRASLERIMYDFPERKFILVGDSGEADLEVYTDVVLANPGRVLGVFIRDVTSSVKKSFFDQAVNSTSPNVETDKQEQRPTLPTRPQTTPAQHQAAAEDLIDFGQGPDAQEQSPARSSYLDDMQQLRLNGNTPPNRPAKPSNLRSYTTNSSQQNVTQGHSRAPSMPSSIDAAAESKRAPPPPPKPRRPSKSIDVSTTTDSQSYRTPFSSQQQNQGSRGRPSPPIRTPSSATQSSTYSSMSARDDEGYAASARRHLTNAYNALPQIRSQSPGSDGASSVRTLASYPAAAARWATGATGGDPAAGGDGGAPGASYNKKEEMWKRRWARAEEIMQRQGIVLKSWRVGSDVMDDCIKLIERA